MHVEQVGPSVHVAQFIIPEQSEQDLFPESIKI
jgi:hypothetical protein